MDDLLHRINNAYFVGHYAVDYESATICLVLSIPIFEELNVIEQMRKAVYGSVNRFDKYLPALMSINFSESDPSLVFIETHLK